MQTHAQPAWLNQDLYPFESHFAHLKAGKVHYVDEGEGEAILFVHGTPTWSFLYRQQIQQLSSRYRCIALDHPGFGLSERMEDIDASVQNLAANLEEFIQHLQLENITLVVHDFGGPIGLAYAQAHPENVKRVVLLNTWLWSTANNPEAQKVDRILHSALGRFLYLQLNFSPKVLLKKGFADPKKLSKMVHQHYLKPFPNKARRRSLLQIGYSLVGASDWYQANWEQLVALEGKPWLILWGMEDSFIKPEFLDRWSKRFPNAKVHRFAGGHFLQEEFPDEITARIAAFMAE